MKRRIAAIATLVALIATPAAAAPIEINLDGEERRNMLLINPGDLFSGVLSLEYERGLARWFGVTLGLSVWTFRGVFTPPGEPAYTGIAPEIGFRFHFIRHAPRGLWIGPYASAGYVFGRDDGSAVTRAWSWGLGAALGYNFTFGRHFTLQLGVGGGFNDYGERLRWDPRFKLGIGATF
jgi:hypothetical protein